MLTIRAPSMVWHMIPQSMVVKISQEEMEADGFDMIASTVMDEDKEKLRSCIRKLKKEGDSISVEYRVCPKEDEIRHVIR